MRKTLRAMLSLSAVALVAPTVLSAQDPIPAAEPAPPPAAAEAVLDAVDGARAAIRALEMRAELPAEDVEVVVVDELFPGEHAAALDQALAQDPEVLTELQAAIAANASISSVLSEKEFTADQVVALSVAEEGATTVYVRKGAIDDPIDG